MVVVIRCVEEKGRKVCEKRAAYMERIYLRREQSRPATGDPTQARLLAR